MTAVEYPSQDFYSVRRNLSYTSSLSSATASVCSDASSSLSQSSDDTTASSLSVDVPPRCGFAFAKPHAQPVVSDARRSLRTNPRRTSNTATSRTGCPPTLVRQAERKLNFVDNLVDSSTQIVEAIWPTSSVVCRDETNSSSVLPLRTFIQETLRRSRTSYSTLQVALYYLVLIKDQLPERDFTMEQTDDCHSSRALQCGRRMFLSALILASKYLQDRNYSARAWSKISGLNTNEINQNEMAFVLAVNWKLHITEEVYHRWTDCVMKYSPSQPPAPGSSLAHAQFENQCDVFKRIIRRLNSDLENLEDVLSTGRYSPVPSLSPRSLSPRSILAAAQNESVAFDCGRDATPVPRIFKTPSVMEPSPSSAQTVARLPPFGLLPTPRLTPQVSAVRDISPPQFVAPGSAMSLAVSTAGSVHNGMMLDRWPGSISSSPQNYYTSRRSSLAASVSTVSSPESMVSDTSGTSRSSSISSLSSLAGAPYPRSDYTNLQVQARYRSAKLVDERFASRPTIPSYGEEFGERITASPKSYSGAVEVDDATNDAAQALQALHDNWQRSFATRGSMTSAPKAGSKRSRPLSGDLGLQENVRDLLRGDCSSNHASFAAGENRFQVPAPSSEGRKRVCCSTEAA
ncbi:hypothetical protein M406DRAFT_273187, partial [Cryphonectria parasitica EP155]